MSFDPVIDMNAIDGAIADLAARTDRPQGYPFSKITIFSVCPEIRAFMPEFIHVSASEVPSMRKLDFKKAGKVFGNRVQEMKKDLSIVPEEYIITAPRFESVDELAKKTTGCRKYLIEIESEDQDDRWLAVQFRKLIRRYITEDLDIQIVPPIFGDKYPEMNRPPVARVFVDLIDCSETLFQALEIWGMHEFSDTPIRLNLPSRKDISDGLDMQDCIEIDGLKFKVRVQQ